MSAVIGSLRVIFGADTAAFERGATEVQRRAAQLERQFKGMGDRITALGQRMTIGLTAPLGAFGVAAVRAASDAQELQSAFNATFADLSASMNEWAEVTGDALGRSTQEIQRGANAFGLYFNQAAETRAEAARMSQTFTVLAQDLASFHNTSVDDALTALRSGLSGETEPLRRFGVFLNEAAVQAQALEMGLVPVNGRLTDQQKIMARAAIIMEATATAQGDVIRTNDSAANTLRRLSGAWEELKVKLGAQILPLFTPLVEGANQLLTRFGELSPTMQRVVVYAGALAAALGPVLIAVGAIANGIAPLIALIGAGGGVFASLAAAAGPVGIALAAIAAAGALIYANWDKIGPLLSSLAQQFNAAIGPPVRQMVTQLSAVLSELWNGPLGEMLRRAGTALVEFEAAKLRIFGPVAIAALRQFANVIGDVFSVIGNVLLTISRLLDGDFKGAWQSAQTAATSVSSAIDNAFFNLPSSVINSISRMVTGIREWLVTRLGAVWNYVSERIERVRLAFFNLYDAVVGNSYIPDMVDGIAAHMRRLESVMVQPATDAADATAERFRALAALLSDLFPESAQQNEFASGVSLLTEALLSGELAIDEYSAAMERLRARYAQLGLPQLSSEVALGMDNLGSSVEDAASRTEAASVRIQESFAQLAQGALSEIDRLVKGIKSGNVVDILSGILGALDKVGGMVGGFNLGPFRFGGARAAGGPVAAGRTYLVGERGPELFTAPMSGKIVSNDNMRGGFSVSVTPSPLFGVVVRDMAGQVVQQAAPTIAGFGAELGQAGMMRRASRVPA